MNQKPTPHRLSRRDFLKLSGVGGLTLLLGRALPVVADSLSKPEPVLPSALPRRPLAAPDPVYIRLAATDGYISLPGRANPLYVFGFVNVPTGATPDDLDVYKGAVQFSSPIIGLDEEDDVYITLTNIGLVVRPDLDDSHTIHWHGFPNATAIFDGVPEVSIAVPVGRDFPYYYKPHRAGTFMYHCHFEDVEHVQMGMQGIVYVRPSQNSTPLGGFTKFAYNDGDGSTGYDREFALILDELWTAPHDNLESIQETIWPNYKANYWTINGRTYPDTLLPNNDPSLLAQPLSSLIQVNAGERILLRFASLGYEQQAMQLPGIPLKVVGEDASFLRNGSVDLSYMTNTIYIGPGEARDVLFTAPNYVGPGDYDTYWLKNRNVHRLTNDGAPGLGGQVTEVRVYPAGTLAAQTHPNETTADYPPTPPYLDPWIV
jgi:FtsP/CotA-like multicopper oxidase with cupredoxin domain